MSVSVRVSNAVGTCQCSIDVQTVESFIEELHVVATFITLRNGVGNGTVVVGTTVEFHT